MQATRQNEWIETKREAYRQALEDALTRIRLRLAEMPEVRKAILFGSATESRRDLFTDLDLVVIMQSGMGFIQRGAELRRHLEAGVDFDLLVYTPEEFERMSQHGFLARALESGRVIYEKAAG
jgi:predicted nucleotidyltransferase